MNKGRIAAIVGLSLVTTFSVSAGKNCRYSADRQHAVSATGVNEVVVDAGAGFLIVQGVADSSEITVTGEACTSRESLLDDIQIVIRHDGERVKIKAEFPKQVFNSANMSLNLEIRVPEGVNLKIDDGSGFITVDNVAAVDIDDGSGSIDVTNVQAVDINDGSGSIVVNNISGDVSIEDGSGEIIVNGISGSVDISDGSGPIKVTKVDKNVEIDDGSGGIDVRDVAETFTVTHDGSGSIKARRIGGDFIVENDGSGGIDYDEITGRVEIPM